MLNFRGADTPLSSPFMINSQPCGKQNHEKKTSHQCSEASLEAFQPAFPKDRRHEQGQEKEGQQEEEEVQGSAPIFHPQNLGIAVGVNGKKNIKFRSNIPILSPTIPMISPKICSSPFSMSPFSSASKKPWLERYTSGTPHSRPRHSAAPCTSHSQCEARPAPNPVRKGYTARNGGAPPAKAQVFLGWVSQDMD